MPIDSPITSIPRRTVQLYAAVAGAWIVVSDLVVALVGAADLGDFALNVAKGLGFVGVTSILLLIVLRRSVGLATEGWEIADEERRRFETLIERSDEIIGVFDDDGRLTYASPSLERVLGWEIGDALDRRGREFVHPDDRQEGLDFLATVRDGTAGSDPQTFRLLTPDGEWRHIEITATDLRHEPAVAGVVVHGRDVTERRKAESQLGRALTLDHVTGASNAKQYGIELRDVALGARAREQDLLILVTDLDAFREVNASVGRVGGDDVLREVCDRIADAVSPAVIGRLGPDEFGVAMAIERGDGEQLAIARSCADRIVSAVGAPLVVDGRRLRLSATVGGVVVRRTDQLDRGRAASEANLVAAKSHPDRVVLSVLSTQDKVDLSGTELVTALFDALERHELQLYYQPQYALADGAVVGAEALIRWNHPERGLLGPAAFLTEATRGSLLSHVTRFVLGEATGQVARWIDQGRDLSVSVNLSLGDLRRQGLVEEVLAAVEGSAIPPASLRLELTEQTLLVEPERSMRTIRELLDAGIGFSIDDFGTGYSSLSHLRSIPVQELKIDQSFTSAMLASEVDAAIVSAVIDLGHRVGVDIVAEGIEDAKTLERLCVEGCDRGQGYHLARPVPATEVSFEPMLLPR